MLRVYDVYIVVSCYIVYTRVIMCVQAPCVCVRVCVYARLCSCNVYVHVYV